MKCTHILKVICDVTLCKNIKQIVNYEYSLSNRMEFETSQYFGKESNILLVRISNTIIMEKN